MCMTVCLSVVCMLSCAKTDELIEMTFGMWNRVGIKNHVFSGDPEPPHSPEKKHFTDMSRPIVKHRKYPA